MNNNMEKIIESSKVIDNLELSQKIRYNYNIKLLKASMYVILQIILFVMLLVVGIKSIIQANGENYIVWIPIIVTLCGCIMILMFFLKKYLNTFILKKDLLLVYTSNVVKIHKQDEKAWLYGEKYFIHLENNMKFKISISEYEEIVKRLPKKVNIYFYEKAIMLGGFDLEYIY